MRSDSIDKLKKKNFDVLIVGGGINGAVCAASLAKRGVKVALIDQKDFASETSQASSNLVWGGIKYLESYEFSLVYKLCESRNKLCKNYPSSVKEIRFFTIRNRNNKHSRFLLYCGTWLYWFIGKCFTRIPSIFSKKFIHKNEPVINTALSSGGIEYSDAYLIDNDSRFVFHFVLDAVQAGAVVANYVKAEKSKFVDGLWTTNASTEKETFSISSKIVINACGPYVDFYNRNSQQETEYCHIFSKGIHLTVKKITPTNKVLTFFADDGRMFFVIPMGNVSCIGTTDTRVETLPAVITNEDRHFVLKNINELLKLDKPLTEEDIIAERCGVRPLVVKKQRKKQKADWLKLSRKHVIESGEKYISVFGGKLTDCLNIGDEVYELVKNMGIDVASNEKWYGESSNEEKQKFCQNAIVEGIAKEATERWWRFYDIKSVELLELIKSNPHYQETIIPEIHYYRGEAIYGADREMITNLEDFLRRRTYLAMILSKKQLEQHSGIKEANEIFFGVHANTKWQEYFKE